MSADVPVVKKRRVNTASKGRRKEYQVIDALKADGWTVVRSAASKGAFDIVAISKHGFRCVQVKAGRRFSNIPKAERERLLSIDVPSNCSVEVWIFVDRQKPRIEILRQAS